MSPRASARLSPRSGAPGHYGEAVPTREDLAALLTGSPLPTETAASLLAEVSEFWFLSAPAGVLADDLARCDPPLAEHEVRVEFRAGSQPNTRRLTVVAHDRRGLLAATTGVLAAAALSVLGASVATWPDLDLAMHGLDVADPGWPDDRWKNVAADVANAVAGRTRPAVRFKAAGEVKVVCAPAAIDHMLVTVEAPDRIGLLWAITSWLADHDASVVAAHLGSDGGRAKDVFLVDGTVRPEDLAAHLGGKRVRRA